MFKCLVVENLSFTPEILDLILRWIYKKNYSLILIQNKSIFNFKKSHKPLKQ